jgi:hypothetical protein
MNERFDEPPIDLSTLAPDAQLRAQRIVSVVIQRVTAEREADLREGIKRALARLAVPALFAAAASLAVVLVSEDKPGGDAFAAFVVPRGPAAAWVATGRSPDVAEVMTLTEGRR